MLLTNRTYEPRAPNRIQAVRRTIHDWVTTAVETAGAVPPQDTAAGYDIGADTAAAGYTEMARDTSSTADQIDTAMDNRPELGQQIALDRAEQIELAQFEELDNPFPFLNYRLFGAKAS